MSQFDRIVSDPNQPSLIDEFGSYYREVKQALWYRNLIHSYPIADLGTIPNIEQLEALSSGGIFYDTIVTPEGDVGPAITQYDKESPEVRNSRDDIIRQQIDEIILYDRAAHNALVPTLGRIAADFRERMGYQDAVIEIGVEGGKQRIEQPIDVDTDEVVFRPHLDGRVEPVYFGYVGRPTRYWPGVFTQSGLDNEDDYEHYERQIASQDIRALTLPPNSVVCVDEHLLHAMPLFTEQDVGTDRMHTVFRPKALVG